MNINVDILMEITSYLHVNGNRRKKIFCRVLREFFFMIIENLFSVFSGKKQYLEYMGVYTAV